MKQKFNGFYTVQSPTMLYLVDNNFNSEIFSQINMNPPYKCWARKTIFDTKLAQYFWADRKGNKRLSAGSQVLLLYTVFYFAKYTSVSSNLCKKNRYVNKNALIFCGSGQVNLNLLLKYYLHLIHKAHAFKPIKLDRQFGRLVVGWRNWTFCH